MDLTQCGAGLWACFTSLSLEGLFLNKVGSYF